MFGAGELRDLHKLTTTFLQSDHGDKGYTERIANLDRDKAHALAEAYLQRLRELAPRADRVIDKMPFNYLDLGIIATLFPRGASSTAAAVRWTPACPPSSRISAIRWHSHLIYGTWATITGNTSG